MLLTLCIGVLLLCLMMGLCIVHFGLLMVTIEHESMVPTLLPGDRVLALRRCFKPWIRKGTVVLLAHASRDGKNDLPFIPALSIKRVVALGGESIALPMPHHCYQDPASRRPEQHATAETQGNQTWHIPAHALFVCGDNREGSSDSRQWGPVPVSSVRGVVLARLPRASTSPSALFTPSRTAALETMLRSGHPAPDFSAHTLLGDTVTLRGYRGHLLLLLFVTTGPLMRQHIPAYLSFAADLEHLGVRALLACDANKESVHLLVQGQEPAWARRALFDLEQAVLDNFAISVRPAYCLIDIHGYVLASGLGTFGGGAWQEDILRSIPQSQGETV